MLLRRERAMTAVAIMLDVAFHAGRTEAVSAADIAEAFSGRCPVSEAFSMDEAVAQAFAAAVPGDCVLLSPGCTSFDWYRNYGERGDDFGRAVRELAAGR
jgi:UDP-N-acetylmuramoylalanine--D-glutamate ligase